MDKFRQQIEDLDIPYPNRVRLLQEVEYDLKHTEQVVEFSEDDLSSLRDIHRSVAYKIYLTLPSS